MSEQNAPSGVTGDEPGARESSLLWYYLGIIQRRIWIVLPLVVIFTTVGLIRAFKTPRVFRATSKLLVERQAPTVMQFERGLQEGMGWDPDYYSTQVELVTSRAVMETAMQQRGMSELFTFTREQAVAEEPGSLLGEVRRSILSVLGGQPAPPPAPWQVLRGYIAPEHVPETHFIQIGVTHPDPVLAATLANAAANGFQAYHHQRRAESLGEAYVLLRQEKDKQEESLRKGEEELQAFRETSRSVSIGDRDEDQPAVERLNKLNQQLTEVQLERIELSSQIGVMQRALQAKPEEAESQSRALFTLPIIQTDEALGQARKNLIEAEKEQALLSGTYGTAHPQYQAAFAKTGLLREQFNKTLQDTVEAHVNRLAMLSQEEKDLQSSYDDQRKETLALARESFTLVRLRNAVDRHRRLLDTIVERMREVDLSSGMIRTNVQVVEEAAVPAYPVSVSKVRRTLIALFTGLFIGVGLAFLFENLDDTVKTPEDLRERMALPLLGFVPLIREDKGGAEQAESPAIRKEWLGSLQARLRRPFTRGLPPPRPETPQTIAERRYRGTIVLREPESSVAEAYRGIRTSLFYSVPANTIKLLAVTSCRPQEGKTTTACNLALSIAQTGKRVLLVDGDLHRPMLHRTLGLDAGPGLTSALVGECTWQEALRQVPLGGTSGDLDVLTAGPSSPNPSELLGSTNMRELLGELRDGYDWVLIDTPPVLFVSDASVMSVLCDGVVLIVRSGSSTRTLLTRARAQLEGVRADLIGTVLNSVLITRMGRHASTYYSYGYSRYARDYKRLYYAREEDEEVETDADADTQAPTPAPAPAPAEPRAESPAPEPEPPARPAEPEQATAPTPAPHASEVTAPAAPQPPPETKEPRRESRARRRARRRHEAAVKKAERLDRQGQTGRARSVIQEVLQAAARYTPAHEALIRLEFEAGRIEDAEQACATLLAFDPANALANRIQGTVQTVHGHYDEAEASLRRSLAARHEPETLSSLAWLLNHRGDHTEAERLARGALELNERLPAAWDTLASTLLATERLDEAENACRRAMAAAPGDVGATLNLADVHARKGQRRRARRLVRRLVKCRAELSTSERTRLDAIRDTVLKNGT